LAKKDENNNNDSNHKMNMECLRSDSPALTTCAKRTNLGKTLSAMSKQNVDDEIILSNRCVINVNSSKLQSESLVDSLSTYVDQVQEDVFYSIQHVDDDVDYEHGSVSLNQANSEEDANSHLSVGQSVFFDIGNTEVDQRVVEDIENWSIASKKTIKMKSVYLAI